MRTLRVKELEVPAHLMAAVSNIICDHSLNHRLEGGDDDEELIFIDVQYDRTNEEHVEAMKKIASYIDRYEEFEDRSEREDDDQEEEDEDADQD